MIGKIKNRINTKKSSKYIWTYIFVFLCIISSFILIEQFNDHSIFGMDRTLIILNLAIFVFIFSVFYLIFFNVKISCIATLAFSWLFGVINHYVFLFRDKPILAVDIFSIRTATDVASNYSFAPDKAIIRTTIFYAVLILVLAIIPLKKKLFSFGRMKQSLLFIVYLIVFYLFFFTSGKLEKWNLRVEFTAQDSFLIYGTALSEVLSTKQLFVSKPEEYSINKVQSIIDEFNENPLIADSESNIKPDVFVIVDEAFADYSSFTNLSLNEDPMDFIHNLNENTIKGTAYTSIWGGNTANSEFEFLTGDTMAFQPVNSVTFQGLVNDVPSIAKTLKKNGYTKISATHPAQSINWNRNTAYKYIGFDTFLTEDDYENPYMIRKFISDKSVFEKLIEQYELEKKNSAEPVFLYTMTIQNHGGYLTGNTYNVRDIINSNSYPFSNEEEIIYFNLIDETDSAVSEFINYLDNRNDPAIVLFFGDHQPRLDEAVYDTSNDKDDPFLKYQVPFFIWANFDIAEEENVEISVNYLSSYLLSQTAVDMTGYQKYLLKLRESIPVITSLGYYGSDGNYYKLDDRESPYYSLVNNYRILQYYNIYDKDNQFDYFFY